MVQARSLAALLLAALLLLPGVARGGGSLASAEPDQLEALFVQRLARYVTWPGNAGPGQSGPVVVAATDARRLRPYFADLPEGRFRLVQWPAADCHVLVINGVPDREAAAIIERTRDLPVLTIGQGADTLRFGAVVALLRVGDHIKLAVSPDAASRAGLSISSRLLSIVRIYKGDSHE